MQTRPNAQHVSSFPIFVRIHVFQFEMFCLHKNFSPSVMHASARHLYICACVFAQQKLSTRVFLICFTSLFVFLSGSGLGSRGYPVNNHKNTHTLVAYLSRHRRKLQKGNTGHKGRAKARVVSKFPDGEKKNSDLLCSSILH